MEGFDLENGIVCVCERARACVCVRCGLWLTEKHCAWLLGRKKGAKEMEHRWKSLDMPVQHSIEQ